MEFLSTSNATAPEPLAVSAPPLDPKLRPENSREARTLIAGKGQIGLEPALWTRGDQIRVSAYLKANGWESYRRLDEGGREATREWRYRKERG